MPQLVMGASACALMLRLSMVNMQGASGLARDTYKFVAVSLTLASVCTALAQITQVCLFSSTLQRDHHVMECQGILQAKMYESTCQHASASLSIRGASAAKLHRLVCVVPKNLLRCLVKTMAVQSLLLSLRHKALQNVQADCAKLCKGGGLDLHA